MANKIQTDYDRVASTYDVNYKILKYRIRAYCTERKLRSLCKNKNVLELGSGTGRLADHLKKSGCLYIGAEFSKEMSQISRDKGHYTVVCDVHRLPMMCESFDIIASAKGVFRYLKPDIAFKECARVLRPNGVLVVHQYARSTWNLRNKQFANPAHLEDEYCLDLYAKNNGLEKISYQKWRSLSFPPYIWPIPKKLKGRWWSQINLYFRKTSKR